MIAEEKVLEKFRKILVNDSTVRAFVQDRVYLEHISSVKDPGFPAISFTILDSTPWFNVADMVEMSIQIDLWFSSVTHTVDDIWECVRGLRALLNVQSIKDATIDVIIYQIRSAGGGAMMYEETEKLHHLPLRYFMVAK